MNLRRSYRSYFAGDVHPHPPSRSSHPARGSSYTPTHHPPILPPESSLALSTLFAAAASPYSGITPITGSSLMMSKPPSGSAALAVRLPLRTVAAHAPTGSTRSRSQTSSHENCSLTSLFQCSNMNSRFQREYTVYYTHQAGYAVVVQFWKSKILTDTILINK